MAMATYLQMVSEIELAKLKSQPTWINQLSKPDEHSYVTHYFCSINYFVSGDAWPSGSRTNPLGGLLFGFSSVSCPTLENGNFGVLRPAEAELVLQSLATVDLTKIRERIEQADPGELEDEEVDDYELLIEDDEPPADVIAAELESLVAFYKRAVRHRYGVISYTT